MQGETISLHERLPFLENGAHRAKRYAADFPGLQGRDLTPGDPVELYAAGDVNCSVTVNSIDASLVLQFTAGLLTTLPCSRSADVNLDGVSNTIDAALILQFDAGLLPNLPP